jgi:hypothetical protein
MNFTTAFPDTHPDVIAKATVITSRGALLKAGDGQSGIIIVDETDHRPILRIDETSDDETIHLFLDPAKDSSAIVRTEEDARSYEILINR